MAFQDMATIRLVTAYVYELITGMKKEADANNTVDFEIK